MGKALRTDPGYRLAWHSNLACVIYDGTGTGVTWEAANKVADQILDRFFNA